MNILCIGDIVGNPGRKFIKENLRDIINNNSIDFVIANGENSAGGVGITKSVYEELLSYGIDVITLGNHTWAKKEIYDIIHNADRLVRPANYPIDTTPGRGHIIVEKNNKKIMIVNICGRVFLECLDCPFKTIDTILTSMLDKPDIIIVDFHAEATSEKIAMGWYLDGRVSAVFGTHTHVQTSDERILPNKTGYITDVGMTGPIDSVLGMEKETVVKKFLTQLPAKFEVAKGDAVFGGIIFYIDECGKTQKIKRLNINSKE